MTLWTIVHTLVWNGEVSRDEDFGFPFNVIAQILKGDTVDPLKGPLNKLKEAESKEDYNGVLSVSNSNYYDGYLSLENRLSGSSLSEISLNNLYNFLTDPEVAAANVIYTATLVIMFRMSYQDLLLHCL